MNRRVWGAVLTMIAAVVAAPSASADEAEWKFSLLPLPAGHEKATGYVTGTSGRGNYSGFIAVGNTAQVVTWTDGRPELRGLPPGADFAETVDQNRSDVIVGTASAYETSRFTPFVLDAAGFRYLQVPGGADGQAAAINERGDVVGNSSAEGGRPGDVVLWPAGGDPQIIKVELPEPHAADIDDDGTILLNSSAGEHLWKDGRLTRLPDPAGHTYTRTMAIKNGWVVGGASSSTRTGFLWCELNRPTTCQGAPIALPGSSYASEINSARVIVGREHTGAVRGPVAVWRGGRFVERLEVPAGELGAPGALAEDGTIVGWVTSGDPSDGGRPAVWLPA